MSLSRILEPATEVSLSKTKIVCTLGPKSREVPTLEDLLRNGMNVARFNFSHGSHEYHQQTLENLKVAMKNTKKMCAVLLDTKGPEIRTGLLKDGKPVQLTEGKEIVITTDYTIEGDSDMISMSYKSLAEDLVPGNTVLCSDGSITLTVLSCNKQNGTITCRCENTAMLGEKKNVNLPGIIVDLPTVTDKDKDDILNWGIPNGIDFIALSFVRKAQDLINVRQLLGPEASKSVQLISKIENQEGLTNFDDILGQTDGIMVARGDLGMEIPTERIFLAQKLMIKKCNAAGKPVVTATQMLESMIKCPRPTRAEATDVANAVIDGTDAVMLSGETAAGDYPAIAVKTMSKICIEAERSLDYEAVFNGIMNNVQLPLSTLESMAATAVSTSNKVQAALIVVLTRGGTTAKLVAKYRPHVPVLSLVVPVLSTNNLTWSCSSESPARHSLVVRGLVPVLAQGTYTASDSEFTNRVLEDGIEYAVENKLCKKGDKIVVIERLGGDTIVKIAQVPKC